MTGDRTFEPGDELILDDGTLLVAEPAKADSYAHAYCINCYFLQYFQNEKATKGNCPKCRSGKDNDPGVVFIQRGDIEYIGVKQMEKENEGEIIIGRYKMRYRY